MPTAIYVNLPCADLKRSMRFFEALGFSFDQRFTNDDAAALVVSDAIRAMLHTPASFRRFTAKQVADARTTTEVLLALQVEGRDEVNRLMDAALAAGANEPRPAEEHGFMFGRAFEDPDGHIWEVFWMDPDAVPQQGIGP